MILAIQDTQSGDSHLATERNLDLDLAAIVSTMKRTVKRALRPFARPLGVRLQELSRRIDEVRDVAMRLDERLPVVENVIESQHALLRTAARDTEVLRGELAGVSEELAAAERQLLALREDVDLATGVRPRTVAPVEHALARLSS